MRPLLSFENVGKRYPDGLRETVVLENASFAIEQGVFTGVWGARRAGKLTLLRLIAGIESPNTGVVRFDGHDLAKISALRRERLLREDIAMMNPGDWHPGPHETTVAYVALSLTSRGISVAEAKRSARNALERVGMTGQADDLTGSLSSAERIRAMLARALIREPRLLLVDEPACIPSLTERDALYGLLREVTREAGTTLVVASEEMAPLHGAEVVMSVGDGELCSTDERGALVRFPGPAPAAQRRP